MQKRTHFNSAAYDKHVDNKVKFDEYVETLYRNTAKEEIFKDKKLKASKMSDKQLSQEIDNWMSNNKGDVDAFKSEYKNSMALLKYNEIRDVNANAANTIIYASSQKAPAIKTNTLPMNMKTTYDSIGSDFFERINTLTKMNTQGSQSGNDLIKNTILYNDNLDNLLSYHHTGRGSKTTPKILKDAYNRIMQTGQAMALDIETLGGRDITGQPTLDMVTEMAFGKIDIGKPGGDFSSFAIGMREGSDAHKNALQIIEDIKKKGFISNRHGVFADRLMKAGHSNTTLDAIEDAMGNKIPGMFKYKTFAGDKDVTTTSTKMMEQGLNKLLDLGKIQSANKVMHDGYEIYGWEKELFTKLKTMKDSNIASASYFGSSFDMPNIQKLLVGGQLSDGGRTLAKSYGLDSFNFQKNHFDLLEALRESALGKDWSKLFTKDQRRDILKKEGMTHFEQQALIKKFFPDFFQNKDNIAHLAESDIKGLAEFFTKDTILPGGKKGNLVDHVMKTVGQDGIAGNLKAGGQQLFYARKSIGMDSYTKSGVMSFVDDTFTGELRTFGGMAIKDGKSHKQLFGQFGIQKGASYTIESAVDLSMEDEFIKKMTGFHDSLATRNLMAMRLSPVVKDLPGRADHIKSSLDIVLIGTAEDLQSEFKRALLLTGEGSRGNWEKITNGMPKGADKDYIESAMDMHNSKGGRLSYTIEDQIQESTVKLRNEAAARFKRSLDIGKEKSMLDMLGDMEKVAKKRGDEFNRATRQRYLNEMITDSQVIAKAVASGQDPKLPSDQALKTFQHYFGYKGEVEKNRIFRETIDKFASSAEYSAGSKDAMKGLIKLATDKAGENNEEAANFYLRQFTEMYYKNLESITSQPMNDVIGNTRRGVRGVDLNKFEIDMSDYMGGGKIKAGSIIDSGENILSVDLSAGNMGLADKIRQMRGDTRVIDDIDKVKELKRFGDHIGLKSISVEDDTVEVATNKIMNVLSKQRKQDFQAGRITESRMLNIVSGYPGATISDVDTKAALGAIDPTSVGEYVKIDTNTAGKITNELFSGLDGDKLRAQLAKDGHSENQIKLLMQMRDIRKKDTLNLVSDLVTGINKSGGGLLKVGGEISFLAHDGSQVPLNLPRDIYQDGTFHTLVGRSKYENPLGLYADRFETDLKLMSRTGKAHAQSYGLASTQFPKAAEEGSSQLTRKVSTWVGDIAENMRKASTITKGDGQDIRSVYSFDVGDVMPQLQRLDAKGVFRDAMFTNDKEMRNILAKNPGRRDFHDMKIISENIRPILENITRHMGDQEAQELVSRFNLTNKNIEDFKGTLDSMPGVVGITGVDGRGVEQQTSRYVQFEKQKIEDAIKKSGRLGPDTRIGKHLYTKSEHAHATRTLSGIEGRMDSHITLKALSISQADLKRLIREDGMDDQMREYLEMVHLKEGAAIANPALIDDVYTARKATQIINIKKTMDLNEKITDEFKRRKAAAPQINIGLDGEIEFTYGKGIFVGANQDLLTLKGMRGEAGGTEVSKYEGLFNFGVRTKTEGLLVSEKDVTNTLRQMKIKSTNLREVVDALESKYDLAYHLDPFDASSHRKLSEFGSEKVTATAIAMGLGERDPRVFRAMTELGIADKKGIVPGIGYVDSLLSKNIAETPFGKFLEHHTGIQRTHEQIKSAIATGGFSSPAAYRDAILEERDSPFKAINQILRGKGILGSGQQADFISDTSSGVVKHTDASYYLQEVVSALSEKNKGDLGAVRGILDKAIPGLEYDSYTNSLIIGDKAPPIDTAALKQISIDEGLRTGKSVNGINYDYGDKVFSLSGSHHDHYKQKAAKLGSRAKLMMGIDAYEEESFGRILKDEKFMSSKKFQEVFGHAIDGSGKVREEYKNVPMLQSVIQELDNARFERYRGGPDDALAIKGGQVIDGMMSGHGVDLNRVSNVLFERGKHGNVSIGALKDLYSASSADLAKDWNRGALSTAESLTQFGYNKISLQDVVLSGEYNEKLMNSGFKKDLLIDLHVGALGDHQIYTTEKDRYLAMPYETQKYYSGTEARSTSQSDLKFLKDKALDIDDRVTRGVLGTDSEDIRRISAMMQDKVVDIKDNLATKLSGKMQTISGLITTELGDARRYTASGHQLYGYESSKFLTGMTFDGNNLVKAASEGTEYNYAIAGRDHFSQYFEKGYLDNIGVTQEQMEKKLRTEGVMQFIIREPQDYKRSTTIGQVYLSDSIKGDQVKIGAATVEAMGGDFDGDTFALAGLRAHAKVKDVNGEWQRQQVDYLTYKALSEQGRVQLDNNNVFKDTIASMYYYAYENKKYSQLGDEGKLARMALDPDILDLNSVGGKLHYTEQLVSSEREVARITEQFDEINDALMAKHGFKSQKELMFNNRIAYREMAGEYIHDIAKDTADEDQMLKTFSKGLQIKNQALSVSSKTTRLMAGESNYMFHGLMQTATMARGYGADISNAHMNAIQQIDLALSEFFLAGKNVLDIDQNMLREFKTSRDLMLGDGGAGRDPSRMIEFLKNTIMDRSELKILEGTPEENIKLYATLGSTFKADTEANRYNMTTITKRGLGQSALITHSDDAVRYRSALDDTLGITKDIIQSTGAKSSLRELDLIQLKETTSMALPQVSASSASLSTLGGTKPLLKSGLTGKDLAFGAIALAGAAMLAGFVGGNPSRSATMQAQSQQSEDMYNIPSMSDQGSPMGQGPGGYIININAGSPKGRQQTIDAMHQAIASSQNTNVNVSMNIRDSGGNITNRNIQKQIEGFFR